MAIFLRPDLTTRLVHKRYGNVDALVAEWETVAATRPAFPKPRQRASIYRWLEEGRVPTKGEADLQIYGFCSLLDVDLLAILDYPKNGYFTKFAALRQLVYLRRLSAGGLATLMEMYRPGDIWPSDAIAQACYGRRWSGDEFTNKNHWQSTDYILVKTRFSNEPGDDPRAVHLAYRRVGVPDTMWRYYGTVIAVDGTLELYNEAGGHQKMSQADTNEIRYFEPTMAGDL